MPADWAVNNRSSEVETRLCRNFVASILPIDLHRVCLDPMAEDSRVVQSTDVILKWFAQHIIVIFYSNKGLV